MLHERAEPDAVGKMKQFATYFTHGVRNGSKLRVAIYQAQEAAADSGSRRRFLRTGTHGNCRLSRLKKVQLITDGACIGNPGPGGWACILRYGEHKKELYGSEPQTTNNRMETHGRHRRSEGASRKPATSRS